MSLANKTIAIPVSSTTAKTSYSGAIRSSDTGAYILEITWLDVDAITGTCQLHFTLADGTSADRDASDGVAISGKKVTYTLEPALYAAKGLKCWVQFINSNLYTPLQIEFGGIEVVPGGTAVPAAEPYPSWVAAEKLVEAARVIAESGRVTAEGLRVIAEGGRVSAEDLRVIAASSQASAEALRVIAEGSRVTAEGLRVTAEGGRVSAENGRVSAESARNVYEAYNPATPYVIGNKVSSGGSSYRSLANQTGVAPPGATWLLIASKGDTGDAGTITAGSTNTTMTGLVAGDGSKIQAPTAAQVDDLPITDPNSHFTTDKVGSAIQQIGSQLAQTGYIHGTTQVPTFNPDGTILKIEHKDSGDAVIRLDEFTHATNTITETRKLNGVLVATLTHHLDTLQTEVV